MKLTEKRKRFLRARAHDLKPVVIVGAAGLTEPVLKEIDLSLAHHELLKVRVNAADRDERGGLITRMCRELDAALVQSIGHVAVLYRPAEQPKLHPPT
ncbi:MAG: ribosome assembly RNA-binding protein YhbY [Gammaproteobacteria bacterium]